MASRDDYTVGWVCALPVEVTASKATLDRVHTELPADPSGNDTNNYVLGSLKGHNVVLAYATSREYGTPSVAELTTHLRASFKSVRFVLLVGIAGGVPNTQEDIRLGDVVVSKPTAGRPGLLQYELTADGSKGQPNSGKASDQPSALLLTAVGKTETAAIFDESRIPLYMSEILEKDPAFFAHPGPEQDVLFNSTYEHQTNESTEDGCDHCNPDEISHRPPRETFDPKVHYGLVASGNRLMRYGVTRDKLAREQEILCFDTEAAGLIDAAQCLVIRGICDYADSHRSDLWHAYAAASAAAYGKEFLSFIPRAPKAMSQAAHTIAVAVPVLDALLLTRPEVDRTSLIALKGRRVDGTCEWLIDHPGYKEWLLDADPPLLWVSGGPGKGKTMLAIYITEVLEEVVDPAEDVLLYYFCSNRDKNRNTAVTVMRGIIHQWLFKHPHLAQLVRNSFEGTETTKYTVSSFVTLWRIFVTLLQHSESRQVICVLDGLDECEKDSLRQLLDAVGNYLSGIEEKSRPYLKLILLSRPRPLMLEGKLGSYNRIKLDETDTEISNDVERYILAKVAELASEQSLSEEMIVQVREALLSGADGTFLWVGFVANELKGRNEDEINEILRKVPKGLGGVYQRLLQQVEEKEKLVPILQWIVLAARPLTVEELTAASGMKASNELSPTEVMKEQLVSCGLLVKIDGDVVNLVHESAKEFFQSEQVDVEGIDMFVMDKHTHWNLMRTCLDLVERSYGSSGTIGEKSLHTTLLAYASLYWPEHFQRAIDIIDPSSEFSRPFFQVESPVREQWWKFFWEQEKNGGDPPSFTLLHLSAYLGNVTWAETLLSQHGRLISRKDTYGRQPLSWAVSRGHKDMAQLLLDRGARVDAKDRSKLTALHYAVTGEHKDIVALLIDRGADVDARANAGGSPLIRAIQANSREIIVLLLERGARVDGLPTPPGATSLKPPSAPMEERARELVGLQEQLFAARYERSSRKVDMVMKALSLSFRIPGILQLVTLYLKYLTLSRWESQHVLQELVKENKTEELKKWAKLYREFFTQIVVDRNRKRLKAMTELPTVIFESVSVADLEALLAVAVMVGSEAKLQSVRHDWRDGDYLTAIAFAKWGSIAYRRDAEESLHYGVRDFLNDFDICVQSGDREGNEARTLVLLTSQFAMIENKDPKVIEYFARVIAEFYESYIGGSYENQLFSDANRGCAHELDAISKGKESDKLLLFLTSIMQFAEHSREKGQDRFFNMLSASCLILCQENASAHRWLIGEAIPEAMSNLILQQEQGPLQKRAFKALVECLLTGRQYGLGLPAALRQKEKQHLSSLMGVDVSLNQLLGL